MVRELTCIVCPLGCSLKADIEGNRVISVSGNNCQRGRKYAETECICPERTVTSTVKTEEGVTVAVKTDRAILKDKVFECMKEINKVRVHLPISVGDVIIKDIFGCNVIATQNKE